MLPCMTLLRCLAFLVLVGRVVHILATSMAVSVDGATSQFADHVREGYRPMLPIHEDALLAAIAAGREVVVLDDKSVGAIVFARRAEDEPSVCMIGGRTSSSKAPFWSFPKGHPDADEDDVTGALREVKEEVGLDVTDSIFPDVFDETRYTFTSHMHGDRWKAHAAFPDESRRPFVVYHKLVRFYLAVLPAEVPLLPQEAEVAAAEWVPLSSVLPRLPLEDMRDRFASFVASAAVQERLRSH